MKNTNKYFDAAGGTTQVACNRLLPLVAGLGGLLYGVDGGIITGALPYSEATFKKAATGRTLNVDQFSFIVEAVLLGGVILTLFAVTLADFIGPKKLMVASGLLFVVRILIIALVHGYWLAQKREACRRWLVLKICSQCLAFWQRSNSRANSFYHPTLNPMQHQLIAI